MSIQKTILLTGATDGIGLATARMLGSLGHRVLLHGRNRAKLDAVEASLAGLDGSIETYLADLSVMNQVSALATAVSENHARLDVLINNAGVFKTAEAVTADGLDIRFAVNTLAPYLLTQRLLPLLGPAARVVNLSSAAQSPVDTEALAGKIQLSDDFAAYAQSKLALTMWSRQLAITLGQHAAAIIAVNPGSMLGSKMVKEAFGVAGGDIDIGAEILTRAALASDFEAASGRYFDNDSGQFASPHVDALDDQKCAAVVQAIDAVLASTTPD